MADFGFRRFFRELKRRKVFRVAAVYAVVAWAVIEVGDVVVDPLRLPAWTTTLLIVLAGLGLPVALVLAWALELTPHGVERTQPTAPGVDPRPARADDDQDSASRVVRERLEPLDTVAPEHSVAVLPFGNLSAAEENAYFAAGVHEEVLTQLSKVEALKVTSRTSVLPYRETEKSLRAIGQELGVRTILEGSVQRVGERIRVSAQLIDARTDRHLWAERYDRTLDDVFAIQTEVALAITDALHAALTPEERSRIERKPTEDAEAYRLYLQGRMHLERRGEEGMRRSIEYFRRATARDSNFALAWAGLAHAFGFLADYGYEDAERALPEAEEAARQALELDRDLAEPHVSLGVGHIVRGEGPAALRELQRAVELRPSYVVARTGLSWSHQLLGRPREALEYARRAVELDPVGLEAAANLSMSLLINRETEEALLEARRMAEIEPAYTSGPFYEGVVLHHLGRFEEAKQLLEGLSVEWTGFGPEATLALAHVASGDAAAAREMLAEFEKAGDAFAAGLAHAALGEQDRAFESFEEIERWGHWRGYWPTLSVRHLYPDVLGPLREDPRFDSLRREVNRSWGLNPDGSIPA